MEIIINVLLIVVALVLIVFLIMLLMLLFMGLLEIYDDAQGRWNSYKWRKGMDK